MEARKNEGVKRSSLYWYGVTRGVVRTIVEGVGMGVGSGRNNFGGSRGREEGIIFWLSRRGRK